MAAIESGIPLESFHSCGSSERLRRYVISLPCCGTVQHVGIDVNFIKVWHLNCHVILTFVSRSDGLSMDCFTCFFFGFLAAQCSGLVNMISESSSESEESLVPTRSRIFQSVCCSNLMTVVFLECFLFCGQASASSESSDMTIGIAGSGVIECNSDWLTQEDDCYDEHEDDATPWATVLLECFAESCGPAHIVECGVIGWLKSGVTGFFGLTDWNDCPSQFMNVSRLSQFTAFSMV